MPALWALSPGYFLVLAFVAGVVGFRIGWRMKSRLVLPVSQALLGWVAFLFAWTTVGAFWSAAAVGAWAIGTTLASVFVFVGRPEATDLRVIRATEYRASMLEWLESGRGPEASVLSTIVRHLREAIWYTAAAIATANLASLVMGAILLNFMNAYVATLIRAARRPGLVVLLAWNLWSVVRVAAYVMIGAGASAPMLRLFGRAVDTEAATALVVAGSIGLGLDVALKLALSRSAARLLRGAIDLEAAKANSRLIQRILPIIRP